MSYAMLMLRDHFAELQAATEQLLHSWHGIRPPKRMSQRRRHAIMWRYHLDARQSKEI